MGVLQSAADCLEYDKPFVAAADQLESASGSPWTVRDALLEAMGCSRALGPVGYEERDEIEQVLAECFARLDGHVDGASAREWVNERGRSTQEVVGALRAAAAAGDVDIGGELHLRAWVRRSKPYTARFPYMALVVLFHVWSREPEEPLEAVFERYGLRPETDPWSLFDRLHPEVDGEEVPEVAREAAEAVRHWMLHRTPWPPAYAPCAFLASVERAAPVKSLEDLHARARARERVVVHPIDMMA